MTESEFPDYAESPFTPQVHQDRKISGTSGLSQNALSTMRRKLIESIMQLVAQAITGILTPFGLGSAFTQLSDWATDITDQITELVLQIPIIGDLLEWLASLFGIDLGDVGNPSVDFGDIWSGIANVFLKPLNIFADLIGGLIPNFQIPSLDASKIVSGFIGDGLLPIINNIIGGITGLFPGFPGSSADVANATAAQTAVLAAISASVAKLEAQFADDDPDTILVEEDFEYVGAPDPAKWDIDYTNSDGGQTVDGHQLKWVKGGDEPATAIMRYIGGSDAESTNDDMTVKIVIGSNVTPEAGNIPSAVDVIGRMNAANTTYVRLRVFRGSFTLYAVNSGVESVIGTQSLAAVPGVGSIITLQCGDASNHRNFLVTINGTTWAFFDGANVSQVGSSYRWRGMGQRAGRVVFFGVFFQENAGPVAHWASQNAA